MFALMSKELHPVLSQSKFFGLALLRVLSIFCLFLLSACVPVNEMIFLQPSETLSENSPEERLSVSEDYKLQVNDILDVKITSTDLETNALFNTANLAAGQVAQATARNGGDLFYLTGYSISQAGLVDLPFIGEISVVGQTLAEAEKTIDGRISELFNSYHLQVKMGGIRFSTLGEFNRPGKHVVMQNQVSILEAIALSGDLTQVANRREVKLVRRTAEGSEIHTLDLLSEEIIQSEFYFIYPNDVIYVEPLPQRAWGIGVTASQTLSAVVSTLSTSTALILSIISLSRN